MIESLDWNAILTLVIKIVGATLGSALVTFTSILFVKLKGKIADTKLYNYIKQAVQAAEQIYPNTGKKMGKEKYQYVLERVLEKYPKLTENEYLKSLIEGAVYAVSEQVKQRKVKQVETIEQVETQEAPKAQDKAAPTNILIVN